jgi:hypothetical protein
MVFRSLRPARAARYTFHAAYATALLGAALALSGCPDGADLEDPNRFTQYTTAGAGGTTPVGGAGAGGAGSGGTVAGSAGTPATGGAPTGGTAGADAGAAGSSGSGGTITPLCDVPAALTASCALAGCHNASSMFADLVLTASVDLRALIDKPASHTDINCNPGGTYMECTAEQAATKCAPGLLVLNSANPAESWMVKKLQAGAAAGCGDDMPLPPGNATSRGWTEERRACLIDYFTQLARSQ